MDFISSLTISREVESPLIYDVNLNFDTRRFKRETTKELCSESKRES